MTTRGLATASLKAAMLAASLALASPALAQNPSQPAATESTVEEPLFVILYRAGPAWTPGLPMNEQGLLEHFYYMRDLHQRGRIVLAGPVGEDGGMVVLRAADRADAEGVMAADPAVLEGKFVGTVSPFVARFAAPGG